MGVTGPLQALETEEPTSTLWGTSRGFCSDANHMHTHMQNGRLASGKKGASEAFLCYGLGALASEQLPDMSKSVVPHATGRVA